MKTPPAVFVIGTMDTKGAELSFLADTFRAAGVRTILVDVGTRAPSVRADVPCTEVAACYPGGALRPETLDRGPAVEAMSVALEQYVLQAWKNGRVLGVIGLGGTGGSALLSPAFRALPIGVPKVLVSTVASGNTAPYVGVSDLTLVNSVVDIAGLDCVSRRILGNAAAAMAGMVANRGDGDEAAPGRVAGMTMFGVTTACVSRVRQELEKDGWECLTFHATGMGGRAMEKMAASGLFSAVLDLTTTEVADAVVGGIFPAAADRFDVLAARPIPCVLSLGALDMVNFGAWESVPEKFRSRRLHRHNSQITLMRTTPDENREFARWMAPRLNRSLGPLVVLVPEKGVSHLDQEGEPFFDPEADAALFDELENLLPQTPRRKFVRLPYHINAPEFAREVLGHFNAITERPAGIPAESLS
jgi:uncharacterized protein (UPF0261 family)